MPVIIEKKKKTQKREHPNRKHDWGRKWDIRDGKDYFFGVEYAGGRASGSLAREEAKGKKFVWGGGGESREGRKQRKKKTKHKRHNPRNPGR